jgi:hypothetical protein
VSPDILANPDEIPLLIKERGGVKAPGAFEDRLFFTDYLRGFD